ncbi:uncharacterized protein LOC118404310 [Branchiostoma floridae]|uniref:Uncharacterized protein LOC118404310 n=1 Tax=Branchiostoma floridae TaxID=7739 RepID=A0A9J7K703_BRAFL|nr:uncharacterized protein LOC118404310 [Branchiostoma floridae]
MAATFRSTRRLLTSAALVVLIQLAFSIGTTSGQTTAAAGSTAAPSTAAPSTAATTAAPVPPIRYEIVLVYESCSIWAIILMLTILVADASMNYTVVKHVASIGPLVNLIIAGTCLVLAPIPFNNGNSRQPGFTTVMIQGSIVAALSFFAAFAGFSAKKHIGDGSTNKDFPYTTMSLLCSVGMMPAIAGTIMSAIDVAPGYQWPGMIMGSICTGLMAGCIIWYITRAVTHKKRVARVAETTNNVSLKVQEY